MSDTELIYGAHAVSAILKKTPYRIAMLYLSDSHSAIQAEAESAGIQIQRTSRYELDQLVPGQQHQGIIARCYLSKNYTESDLPKFLQGQNTFLLILDGVQDPHNLGACLRTADAAGVHAVIAPKDRSASLTPTVRKVACGAAETVPFIQVTNLSRTLRWLKKEGVWLIGMDDQAEKSIYQTDCKGPIALVLGAEGTGLRHLTQELCDYLAMIPMYGSVSSLNVSVATGVCLFEAMRQRNG